MWATFVQALVFGEIWFHHKDRKPFVPHVQYWLGEWSDDAMNHLAI
jgi:hypothetical protein